MSPPDNALYANHKSGRIKTAAYRRFESECFMWAMEKRTKVQAIQSELKKIIAAKQVIKLDLLFYFQWSDVWTKDGKPKIMDTTNRVKATNDQLAKILQIDDRYFFAVFCDKVTATTGKKNHCKVTFYPWLARSDSESS